MPAEPLTLPEREEIRAGLERGESLTAIAVVIGRHRCTVSAEVSRNGGRAVYRATVAQARADRGLASAQDGMLLMIADPSPSPNEQFAYPSRYFRPQADGSLWSFDAYGLDDQRRRDLADKVLFDPLAGFTLPDPSMSLLAQGVDGGLLQTQVFASAHGRVVLSVGDYRGLEVSFAESGQVLPVSVAGASGYEVRMLNGEVHLVWETVEARWAMLVIPKELASRTAELAGAVTAASVEEPGTERGPSAGLLYSGSVYVIEAPSQPPMIALGLDESYPPGGGDIPLAGWNWDDVPDETTVAGTTWGGPWEITGTWDGSTFTVTRPPIPGPADQTRPLGEQTPGCDQTRPQAAANRMALLDLATTAWLTANVDVWNGRCGVVVRSLLDSPALREAIAPFADEIEHVEFVFEPVT